MAFDITRLMSEFKIRDIIRELNYAILERQNQQKQKSIEEILLDENWVSELRKYVESEIYLHSAERAIFSNASSEIWVKALRYASVEDIDIFRRWFYGVYSENVIREYLRKDLPVIKEIVEKICLDEETDLIKKLNLRWLREKMERVVASNQIT